MRGPPAAVEQLLERRAPSSRRAGPARCRTVVLPVPALGNDDRAKDIPINDHGAFPCFASYTVRGLFRANSATRQEAMRFVTGRG